MIAWRPAVASDIPAINAIAARSVRTLHVGSYADEVIAEAVEHAYGVDWQLVRDSTYFAVEIDGLLAGAGGWSYRQTIAGAYGAGQAAAPRLDASSSAARIRSFYVDPRFARRGIGRLLLSISEDAARAAGFSQAELTSTLPAVSFYETFGYRPSGTFDLPLPSGAMLRLELMTKAL